MHLDIFIIGRGIWQNSIRADTVPFFHVIPFGYIDIHLMKTST